MKPADPAECVFVFKKQNRRNRKKQGVLSVPNKSIQRSPSISEVKGEERETLVVMGGAAEGLTLRLSPPTLLRGEAVVPGSGGDRRKHNAILQQPTQSPQRTYVAQY